MALDSDLRPFSLFFKFVWSESNILSPAEVTEFCVNERLTEAEFEEISDQCLLQAFLAVRHFYAIIFRNSIDNDKNKYPKPREESCDYIKRMCNDVSWIGRPTIFERCFATISFVLTCSEYTEEAFSDIKRNADVIWSRYFYEYKKEFYNEGGWKKLRRIADSYAKVSDLIRIVNPAQDSLDFINLYKSVENYMYFCMIFINRTEIQYKTCTSLWIKFIVKNGNTESFAASWPKSPSEVTCLLRALRYYCNPYGFKVDKSKRNSNPRVLQKPIYAAISSPGRNLESCTKKEVDRKREPQSPSVHKNSNFNEARGQESLNSFIKNVSLHNTAVAKKYEVKDTKIENFTGGGTDRTYNMVYTSSTSGERWKKVQRKRNEKKYGLQVFNEILELGEEIKQASSNSSNSFSLQNTAIEKGRKDRGKENFTRRQNGGMNVPCTSSMADEMLKKPDKRKGNKKKVEVDKETRQATSIIYGVPLQNTEVGKEHKESGKKNYMGDENEGTNNLPYMAGEMETKTKRKKNPKKAGLQVLGKI